LFGEISWLMESTFARVRAINAIGMAWEMEYSLERIG
jgi:hypothetical protein